MSKIQEALKKQMQELEAQIESIQKVEENAIWIDFTVASIRGESLAMDHPESQYGRLLGTPYGRSKLTMETEGGDDEITATELASAETHWKKSDMDIFEAKYDEVPVNQNGRKAVSVRIAVEKTVTYTDSTDDGSPRAILKVVSWDGELRPPSRNIVVPKDKETALGWTAAARERREAARNMNRITPPMNAPMSAPMDTIAQAATPTPTPTSTKGKGKGKGKGFGQTV